MKYIQKTISLFILVFIFNSYAFAQYCDPTSSPGPGSSYMAGAYSSSYWAGSPTNGAPSNYPYYTNNIPFVAPFIMAQGGTYPLQILSGPSTVTFAAYIDFNGDFDFTDAGELIGQVSSASANQLNNIVFTVPVNAQLGLTRMRLRSGPVSYGPCGLSNFSEAEDYAVNITAGCYPYCFPSSPAVNLALYINSVSLGSINNTTGSNAYPVYGNFTNLSTNLTKGNSYNLVVGYGLFPGHAVAAYIDYNHNNVFSANEKIGEYLSVNSYDLIPFNFTVPASATNGTTLMRIRCGYNVGMDPCSGTTNGETEDYSINIVGGSSGSCNELFFSEYLEGSSNDKALELYNPSGTSISLAPYSIEVYNNGSLTPSTSFSLTGSLASNDVFVVANASASATILAQADATSSICQFNGNDAVALLKNGSIIDVIGEIGINPGASWSVGTGSTQDHTLVRNPGVTGPSGSWSTSQTQWTSYANNTTNLLGSNSSLCIPSSIDNLNPNTGITLSSNIVTDRLYVQIESRLLNEQYTIIDQTGRVALKGVFSQEQNSINCSGIANGVYFLKIETVSQTFKLIKQ